MADEPQVGLRPEDVERKQEYYHIIILLKELRILHKERRGQVKTIVVEQCNESSCTSPDLLTSSIPINNNNSNINDNKLN
jgi:hypothetical protein